MPVIAHVSDSGTAIAAARARHAEQSGAAAIVATPPYYWTPPPAMLLEHFAMIGSAVRIPFFVYNAPDEMGGVKMTTDLALKLLARLKTSPHVDASSTGNSMSIDLRRAQGAPASSCSPARFSSRRANRRNGLFSPLAGIAPALLGALRALPQGAYRDARRPRRTSPPCATADEGRRRR